MKTKEKVEQGKGTADHLMPLGYLFTPLVTPNVTPWLAILPTLVRVVYATFVMHKTTVYKQKYAA